MLRNYLNKIINNVQQFFQNNQKIFGIVLIIIGVILFVYTLTTGKKILQNNTNRYRIKDFINIFGEKIGEIAAKIFEYIIAINFIIAGIVFLVI
jgi:hypothetical protein